MSKIYEASLISQIITKRGITLVIYYAVSPKVYQHFYIWSVSAYHISTSYVKQLLRDCVKHFIIDTYIQVVKGNNFITNGSIEKLKNKGLLIFHIESAYKVSES